MKQDDVMRILIEHRDARQRQFGAKSLALFGSVARNEAIIVRDVNLLVEFDRPIGLFHFL
jgi:predicted nucleotidyltransferase